MQVSEITIKNFRSIEGSTILELSNLNILVGANNSGKSSIIKALHLIQEGQVTKADIRSGTDRFSLSLAFDNIPYTNPLSNGHGDGPGLLMIEVTNGDYTFRMKIGGATYNMNALPNREPHHFVVPFLSKRKTSSYDQDVKAQQATAITNDLRNLAAKLSRISNHGHPRFEQYRTSCLAALGFMLTAVLTDNGHMPGIYLEDGSTLTIDQMGEGVSNIAALLIFLAESKNKLFLIEELENDLHPKALKALLDLIIESSKHNQFVISTHSNIVVRHLASVENSKLYNINTVPGSSPPKAQIELIPPTVEARIEVLYELGYSFSDFDLWDGWLIVEEASAERIIRDYLIPWFVPELTRIRTISTKGADEVEPMFKDWNRLVCYAHLEEAYKNRAWVRVDGDTKGIEIIDRLKSNYKTWTPDRFSTYNYPQFEQYYPKEFEKKVIGILDLPRSKEKSEAKKQLLAEVRAWLDNEDKAKSKAALAASAKEIIDDLKVIAAQLKDASA